MSGNRRIRSDWKRPKKALQNRKVFSSFHQLWGHEVVREGVPQKSSDPVPHSLEPSPAWAQTVQLACLCSPHRADSDRCEGGFWTWFRGGQGARSGCEDWDDMFVFTQFHQDLLFWTYWSFWRVLTGISMRRALQLVNLEETNASSRRTGERRLECG